MAKLDCKPHLPPDGVGNSNIWFCAHPDDFEEYFDKITDDIINKYAKDIFDITVWYDREPYAEYDAEKFLSDLKQMKVFVVAVTRKFLTEESRARSIELKYASENTIPILPLMLESGLDSLFAGVFGNLQYLDPFSVDSTAISYGNKISSFFSSVFLSNKERDRIAKEFDTTIFLSYRKIDRAYAQELMEIIHKNEKFRDVAIWYDEFLTPGEDFNNSIKAAIKTCRVFVMAVTPNTANMTVDKNGEPCDNYIVSTEYPLAYNLQKPIIAYTMADDLFVDINMRIRFRTLTDRIPANHTKRLYLELEKKLSGVSLGAKRTTSEHEYLIGLAYLTGTFVEQNKLKGIELITSAAENGNIEAMERLSSIYRMGDGVIKDDTKNIFWQKKILRFRLDKLKSCSEKSVEETEQLLMAYMNAVSSSSVSFVFNNQLWEIDQHANELKSLYSDLKNTIPKAKIIQYTLYRMYQTCVQLSNNNAQRRKYCILMLEVAKEIHEINQDKNSFFMLAESLYNIGKYYYNACDYQKAEEYCLSAMHYARKAVETDGVIFESTIELSKKSSSFSAEQLYLICTLRYAKVNIKLGNFEKGAECYRNAALKIESLSSEDSSKQFLQQSLEIDSFFLAYSLAQNDLAEAERYYQKSLEDIELLKKQKNSFIADEIEVIMRMGAYNEIKENYYFAEKYYIIAQEKCNIPLERMKPRAILLNLLILKKLAGLYEKSKANLLAQNCIERIEEFSEEYRHREHTLPLSAALSLLTAEMFFTKTDAEASDDDERDENVSAQANRLYNSAQSHMKSGNIHLQYGNSEKAKENFKKAADILRTLLEGDPENEDYTAYLAEAEDKINSADSFAPPVQEKKKHGFFSSVFKRK